MQLTIDEQERAAYSAGNITLAAALAAAGGVAEANAARIVACVNACDGMADPAVWIGMQEKEAQFAKTEIPRLAGQVDSLRAEVERLREALAAAAVRS